ncbi:MAG: Gfo/Idh/MocA family oxidoreductase [Bacteroidetes bacterium]|nr:Gfo/Idh/MocA family oxidoreductase [Bacteroidota bacterium]
MKSISVALVGCGRISEKHFEALLNLKQDYTITSVCDTVQENLEKAVQLTGAKGYLNYETLLENEHPDLVVLCTPSGLHARQGVLAARKGFHVLSEKPMATKLKDADELIKACDQAGVRLFVVKQNRLNSTIQLLKKAIDKNRFGKIFMVEVNVFWTRPQSYYDAAKWRGTWEFDGGAFLNQASHYVDLLSWLIGPVESVSAMTGTLARKIEAEDTGAAVFRYRNGAIGTMNVTMLTYPKNLEGSITVMGEKGTVRIGGIAVNDIRHWEFDSYDDDDKAVETSSYKVESVYGFGHLGYYKNVADALLRGHDPNTDGREGRKSLELIEAIYLSAKEKRFVNLPL